MTAMDIRPRLVARTSLPGLTGIDLGYNLFRWPGVHLLALKDGPQLRVYDVAGIISGETEPLMCLDAAEPAWTGIVAPSPGADFVVQCRKRELRAVDRDGAVLWTHPHACWGCADETDHTDRYTCGEGYSGSAYVNADGTRVWAHVASKWDDDAVENGEHWLVLDALDGSLLTAVTLESSATAGSSHILLPDGRGVFLGTGYGQDGSSVFFGVFDEAQATLTEFDGGFRVPLDVDPTGTLLLTAPHPDGDDVIALHRIPGGERSAELRSADVPFATAPEHSWWDYSGGFVDAHTIVGAVHQSGQEDPEHWLVATSGEPIGPILYGPDVRARSLAALGDGRWATTDYDDHVLRIWER
jgi:hypothetical protein